MLQKVHCCKTKSLDELIFMCTFQTKDIHFSGTHKADPMPACINCDLLHLCILSVWNCHRCIRHDKTVLILLHRSLAAVKATWWKSETFLLTCSLRYWHPYILYILIDWDNTSLSIFSCRAALTLLLCMQRGDVEEKAADRNVTQFLIVWLATFSKLLFAADYYTSWTVISSFSVATPQ